MAIFGKVGFLKKFKISMLIAISIELEVYDFYVLMLIDWLPFARQC